MKYVPSLPPVAKGERESLDVHAMGRVNAAKPVQPLSLQPLAALPQVRPNISPYIDEPLERRRAPQALRDRRTYCRRVEHMPILVEMRSGPDRRHHKRRQDDPTEHIDEDV